MEFIGAEKYTLTTESSFENIETAITALHCPFYKWSWLSKFQNICRRVAQVFTCCPSCDLTNSVEAMKDM